MLSLIILQKNCDLNKCYNKFIIEIEQVALCYRLLFHLLSFKNSMVSICVCRYIMYTM